jgi:hypothetical protein
MRLSQTYAENTMQELKFGEAQVLMRVRGSSQSIIMERVVKISRT